MSGTVADQSKSTKNAHESHKSRTSSSRENDDSAHKLPRELAQIVERWADLPDHIRAAILALVNSTK